MRTLAIYVRSRHHGGKLLLGENFIRKHYDFVASLLMQLHQVLTCYKLVRIAHVENFALCRLLPLEVLTVEVGCHLTLHFDALDFGQVSLILQILPVCLIQFWTNQKIEFSYAVILSHKSGSQTQFAVRFYQ